MTTAQSLREQANDFYLIAKAEMPHLARYYRTKAREAVAYTEKLGGSALLIPSKLTAVTAQDHQAYISEFVKPGDMLLCEIVEIHGAAEVELLHCGPNGPTVIGRLHAKHRAWARVLVSTPFGVPCEVLQVTGGTRGNWYGVNIRLQVGTAIEQQREEDRQLIEREQDAQDFAALMDRY